MCTKKEEGTGMFYRIMSLNLPNNSSKKKSTFVHRNCKIPIDLCTENWQVSATVCISIYILFYRYVCVMKVNLVLKFMLKYSQIVL